MKPISIIISFFFTILIMVAALLGNHFLSNQYKNKLLLEHNNLEENENLIHNEMLHASLLEKASDLNAKLEIIETKTKEITSKLKNNQEMKTSKDKVMAKIKTKDKNLPETKYLQLSKEMDFKDGGIIKVADFKPEKESTKIDLKKIDTKLNGKDQMFVYIKQGADLNKQLQEIIRKSIALQKNMNENSEKEKTNSEAFKQYIENLMSDEDRFKKVNLPQLAIIGKRVDEYERLLSSNINGKELDGNFYFSDVYYPKKSDDIRFILLKSNEVFKPNDKERNQIINLTRKINELKKSHTNPKEKTKIDEEIGKTEKEIQIIKEANINSRKESFKNLLESFENKYLPKITP